MILFKMHKNKKIILIEIVQNTQKNKRYILEDISLILDLYEEDIVSEMYLFCVTFQYCI